MNRQNWLQKRKKIETRQVGQGLYHKKKRGFLASSSIYVCTEHEQKDIDLYFENLIPVFNMISECESGKNIDDYLEGPVCSSGFKRLN